MLTKREAAQFQFMFRDAKKIGPEELARALELFTEDDDIYSYSIKLDNDDSQVVVERQE